MAAYFIYSVLDWPGISTAVPTCFVVALGSMGETIQKMWLRISGALIGGLAAGLCIVYLLPHMTDIGQLCLLIAVASAIFAWVATSSDRLSYMGMQMALAFLLGVLQGYGPNTSLTVLWDRVVGVLLGNLLMSLVFSVVWPISALDRARAAIAQALRALGNLMRDAAHPPADVRLAAVQRLTEARHFTSVAAFERNLMQGGALRRDFRANGNRSPGAPRHGGVRRRRPIQRRRHWRGWPKAGRGDISLVHRHRGAICRRPFGARSARPGQFRGGASRPARRGSVAPSSSHGRQSAAATRNRACRDHSRLVSPSMFAAPLRG